MANNLETVVFQVTTKCPYQCPQCYMERGNLTLPLDFAKEIVSYAYICGAQALQITGGEPILYPHLQELISFASGKGMYTFLATSGYGASRNLYTELKILGLTAICVSINNINKFDNSRSRDTYVEALSAIKIAKECGLCCFANAVVSDENASQLEFLGCYLSNLGVQGIHILRPVPSHDGKYIPTISPETIEFVSNAVKKYPERFFVENCYKEYWCYEKKSDFLCSDIGKTTFFVNADSSFSLCSKKNHIRFQSLMELEQFTDYKSVRCSGSCIKA